MVVFSQCMDCKNYIGKKGDVFCCKAFPEGISDDIFWNKKYHIEHIDGIMDINLKRWTKALRSSRVLF